MNKQRPDASFAQILEQNLGFELDQTTRIIGIGSDLCAVSRMEELCKKYGQRFAQRILSAQELVQWEARDYSTSYLAKRWAGKEAVVKSLGSGFAKGLRWREISVLNDMEGKPFIQVSGQTLELLHYKISTDLNNLTTETGLINNENKAADGVMKIKNRELKPIEFLISLTDEQQLALGFVLAFVRF